MVAYQETIAEAERSQVFSAKLGPNSAYRSPRGIGGSNPPLIRHQVLGAERLIKHARYYWLLLAESHLTRRLSGSMLQRIAMLPSPAA